MRHSSATRLRGKRMWLALVAIVGVVCAVWCLRSGLSPVLTWDRYNASLATWEQHRPASYQVTVEVTGRQPGVYEVEVRDRIVRSATFDGRKLTRRRTFDTWAVRGMFETLRMDLETNDRDGILLLRADFDSELGYPRKYERIEMRTGAHDALKWEVTRFSPHE